MVQASNVEICLRIAPGGATSIEGTAECAGLPAEPFTGWLELTAAVARVLSAIEADASLPAQEETCSTESLAAHPSRRP